MLSLVSRTEGCGSNAGKERMRKKPKKGLKLPDLTEDEKDHDLFRSDTLDGLAFFKDVKINWTEKEREAIERIKSKRRKTDAGNN